MSLSVTFGRGPDVDVVVDDEYVSPQHCRITYDGRRSFFVYDLGSTNGTWVYNKDLGERRVRGFSLLYPGDQVRIGRTTLPWEAR